MGDIPKKIVTKLNRSETVKQLTNILHLFDITITENKKVKINKDKPETPNSDLLSELIAYIRVSVKYKLFETEALSREVAALKKICKDNNIELN